MTMENRNNKRPAVDRKYYNRTYYNGLAKLIDMRNRFTRVKVNRVSSLLKPQAGEMILDIGCGGGTMVILLSGSGASMVGLDFSEDSLRIAKENFTKMVPQKTFRAVCTDSRNIGLKDESIDGITAVDFTEHVYDAGIQPVVLEMYRILKSGGRLVIYTPNVTHLFEQLKKRNIILKENKSHVGLRTMDDYISLCKKCGFTIRKSFFEPTHLPVYSLIERLLMNLPAVGGLFKRRICILAVKKS
jgi:ubiquinone/menaquinone biosynthesis C-methylase UbiE